MEKAVQHERRSDGAGTVSLDFVHARGGSAGLGLPRGHAPAIGRLPLRSATDDPAPLAFDTAPLSATARHQSLPGTCDKPKRKAFKKYPIGTSTSIPPRPGTEEGWLYLFVGIDRTSKFAYVELHERQKRATAVEFFRRLTEVVPYRVLTDPGSVQFTNRKKDRWAFRHLFDRVCHEHGTRGIG